MAPEPHTPQVQGLSFSEPHNPSMKGSQSWKGMPTPISILLKGTLRCSVPQSHGDLRVPLLFPESVCVCILHMYLAVGLYVCFSLPHPMAQGWAHSCRVQPKGVQEEFWGRSCSFLSLLSAHGGCQSCGAQGGGGENLNTQLLVSSG